MFVDEKPLTLPALIPWQREIYRAIDGIRQHGWCQWRNKNALGQMCITGALYYSNGEDWCDTARRKIEAHIGGQIEPWNNALGRTQDQVISLLQKVVTTS